MDLKIKDVAELLNVSESTVRRWLADGKIPTYRINQQYRFNQVEIEDWVMAHKTGKHNNTSLSFNEDLLDEESIASKSPIGGSKQFSLYRAIHKGGLFYNVPGETKEELICAATKQIALNLNIDAEIVSKLLLEREALQPTALNNGIAIPHTRDFFLHANVDAVAVVFPAKPADYGAFDGKPVDTLFFLFASNDRRHLHLLAKIAHLSSQAATLDFLKTKPNKDQLLEYIKGWESRIQQPAECV